MSEPTARLLSWLRYGDRDLDAALVEPALDALAQLEADRVWLSNPSLPGDIVDVLQMVASTIQTELPQEMGLTAYIAILQELPPHVLKAAAIEILKKHSFRTMPLPAEFLATDAVREWGYTSPYLKRSIPRWRKQLEKIRISAAILQQKED